MAKQITIESVLRTLTRLQMVRHAPAEDLAAALSPYFKAQHLIEVASYLERVGARMYTKQSKKKCAECGGTLDSTIVDGRERQLRFVRADIRYCSVKCKQKAYRKRVMPSRAPVKDKPSRVTAASMQKAHQA